jgi:multimeric flavodoxin WrbA
MKALCIISSPQESGNTAYITGKIIEGMEAAGIRAEKVCLGSMNIHYCRGCGICEKTRRCVQRDDMDTMIESMIAANIILIASPSYWGDITGQLKVFFDRSTPLCNAINGTTGIPEGKTGIAVAVRRGRSPGENMHIIESIEHYFGHLGIAPKGRYMIEGVGAIADIICRQEKIDEAYGLGLNILKS